MNVELIFQDQLGDLIRLRRGRLGVSIVLRNDSVAILHLHLSRITSLKDLIESLGVPHCEIGTVSGDLHLLDDLVQGDCRVWLAPVAPHNLDDARFLCDGHLGRLTRLLRHLGFDTLWNPAWGEAEIARRGVNQQRVVLSRSLGLLKRRELIRALLVRPDDPVEQARQVVERFLLHDQVQPMGRCSACNGVVKPVAKDDVLERIPPKTAAWIDEYFVCTGCGKLYWEGTHREGLRAIARQVLGR